MAVEFIFGAACLWFVTRAMLSLRAVTLSRMSYVDIMFAALGLASVTVTGICFIVVALRELILN